MRSMHEAGLKAAIHMLTCQKKPTDTRRGFTKRALINFIYRKHEFDYVPSINYHFHIGDGSLIFCFLFFWQYGRSIVGYDHFGEVDFTLPKIGTISYVLVL